MNIGSVRVGNALSDAASRWRFLFVLLVSMVAFYAALYHQYPEDSVPGRLLTGYLELVARASAAVLGLLGEAVSLQGTTVVGRFPFSVVLDCGALDAQALFAAAVLAFPTAISRKLIGLAGGLSAIGLINVVRLILLYFAGIHSVSLFHVLHEEVMVLFVIASVCGMFLSWAWWARSDDVKMYPQTEQA